MSPELKEILRPLLKRAFDAGREFERARPRRFAAPGPPPRPGLQWKEETHRWIHPHTGEEYQHPDGHAGLPDAATVSASEKKPLKDTGERKTGTLEGGTASDIHRVNYGGRDYVVKSAEKAGPLGAKKAAERVHAEELSSRVAADAGVNIPAAHAVELGGKPHVVSEFVSGTPLASVKDPKAELAKLPKGEVARMVLFDFATGYSDNHLGNYLIGNDGHLHGIDRETSFGVEGDSPEEMAFHLDENKFLRAAAGTTDKDVKAYPLPREEIARVAAAAEKMLPQLSSTAADTAKERVALLEKLATAASPTIGDLMALCEGKPLATAAPSPAEVWRKNLPAPEQVTGQHKTKKARKELARDLQDAWTQARNALAVKHGTRAINDKMTPEENALEGKLLGILGVIESGHEYNGPHDLGPVSDTRYAGYYRGALETLAKLHASATATHAQDGDDEPATFAAPGPPPRPGLTWKDETHRWVNPHTGEEHEHSPGGAALQTVHYHGPTAPGEGWTHVASDPQGNKVWQAPQKKPGIIGRLLGAKKPVAGLNPTEAGHTAAHTIKARMDASPQYQAAAKSVEARNAGGFQKLAQQSGKSVEEVKQEAVAKAQALVNAQDVYVRVPDHVLPLILQAGRFKTTHETGTSGGLANKKLRAAVEEKMGVPADAPNETKPISVYLGGKDFSTVGQEKGVGDYGNLVVKLKPSVRERATVTLGDSLQQVGNGTTTVSPMQAIGASTVNPSELLHDPKFLDSHAEYHKEKGFIEGQVHGGVSTHDIEEVGFPSEPPAEMQKALDSQGIKWRVYGAKPQTHSLATFAAAHKDGEEWETNGRKYKRVAGKTVRVGKAKDDPKKATADKSEDNPAPEKTPPSPPEPVATPSATHAPVAIDWQHKDATHPVAKAIAGNPLAASAVGLAAPHAEAARQLAELSKRTDQLFTAFQKSKGSPDRGREQAANDAWWAAHKERKQKQEAMDKLNESVRAELLTQLKTDNGVKVEPEMAQRRSWWNPLGTVIKSKDEVATENKGGEHEELMKKSVECNERAVSYAKELLGSIVESHGEPIPVEVGFSGSGRAFMRTASGTKLLGNQKPIIGLGIKTRDNDAQDSAIHELGHLLEESIPGIKEQTAAFLEYRLGDEKPVDLGTVPGGEDMRGEKGRKDNFDRAFDEVCAYYVGKTYSGGATEVLSMGLEKLHRDPVGFMATDPEFAGFIIGLLRRAKS